MSTLAAWNDAYGDLDIETPDKKTSGRFAMRTGVCYHIVIRGASLCRSNYGDVQVMLDLDVKDGDTGAVVGQVKDWLSLPMQPQTDLEKQREVVLNLTRLRRNLLGTIMGAVDPRTYLIGDPQVDETGDKYYLSWSNGHRMSREEVADRRIEVNRAVIQYAKECHEMANNSDNSPTLEGWVNTELYHAKKENPKNAKYPYSMYFREPPVGMPVFTTKEYADSTAEVPF